MKNNILVNLDFTRSECWASFNNIFLEDSLALLVLFNSVHYTVIDVVFCIFAEAACST